MLLLENPQELEDIPLTNRGEICDSSQKLFSKEVVDERAQINQQKKLVNSITRSNCKQIDDVVRKDSEIFKNSSYMKRQELCPSNTPNTFSDSSYTNSQRSSLSSTDTHVTSNLVNLQSFLKT